MNKQTKWLQDKEFKGLGNAYYSNENIGLLQQDKKDLAEKYIMDNSIIK